MAGENNSATDSAGNLERVRAELAAAVDAAERPAGSVALVAVSKNHPGHVITPILQAGHRVFGENRVQEARQKWPALKLEHAGIRLHLIGPLQSNKARQAVALFDVIETVDREKLARALARIMDETGDRPDCMIQVNTGEEDRKAGVAPLAADDFIACCRDELKLPVVGLMCIPPLDEEPSPHFALLAQIARRNGLRRLSMGMSADYRTAVRFGATHVRVGTAIFGPRR